VSIIVLGIGGSSRPNSTTERALRFSLDAAAESGAETVLFGAADLRLPLYAPESIVRHSGAARLLSEVRRCHGLIVASPGYHGAVSGMVKNALDYVEDLRDDDPPYLDGKAIGCVATATGWQAAMSTLMSLRSIVHALRGWPTPMGATINTAEPIVDKDGRFVDGRARFQLELVGQQVVEFARMRSVRGARAGVGE
jgi:FMN reductase